jgi:hypothetical protein
MILSNLNILIVLLESFKININIIIRAKNSNC